MIIRATMFFGLFLMVFWLPWWLLMILVVLYGWRYRFVPEIIFLGLVFDGLFMALSGPIPLADLRAVWVGIALVAVIWWLQTILMVGSAQQYVGKPRELSSISL